MLSWPLFVREFEILILLLHQSDHALRVVGPESEFSSFESLDDESIIQGLETVFFRRFVRGRVISSSYKNFKKFGLKMFHISTCNKNSYKSKKWINKLKYVSTNIKS